MTTPTPRLSALGTWTPTAAKADPDVAFMESCSTAPAVADRIKELRGEFPGPVFAILDSDHSAGMRWRR
jgi:cephalosporin hydroxylase